MLGVLNQILCWIEQIGAMAADAMVWIFNAVLVAIAAMVSGLLALLPGMPSLPTMPTEMQTGIAWVGEFWPVGTTIDITAFLIGAWLVWLVVGVGLRWAKVIS